MDILHIKSEKPERMPVIKTDSKILLAILYQGDQSIFWSLFLSL